MNNEIMVSICCLVYNHEKYLRKCLDGFVMQKTNFKFEVLIHDDASTDNSAQIIREYQEKYPDIIKPIFQTENQYSKGVRILLKYHYPRAKGKYIALCEGDDYWCDIFKLQKQVDKLETNTESSVCGHQVRFISETGDKLETKWTQENINTQTISSKELISKMALIDGGPWFHTSSFLFRSAYVKELVQCAPDFFKYCAVGDYPTLLFLLTKGNVEYFADEMSLYRLNSESSVMKNIFNNRFEELKENEIKTYKLFDEYTEGIYRAEIYYHIELLEFLILKKRRNFSAILNKKYRKFYSNRYYVYCKVMSICPWFGWVERLFL